jgi:hypothetical protein
VIKHDDTRIQQIIKLSKRDVGYSRRNTTGDNVGGTYTIKER